MNTKRTSVTVSDMVLYTAVLLGAVLLVEFDEAIGAFVARHISMLMFMLMSGCTIGAAYFLLREQPGAAAGAPNGLPQTWSRTLDKEPGCDLCGGKLTSFECVDHELTLCAGCSQRYDAHYRCNIRYVPAVRAIQERRV